MSRSIFRNLKAAFSAALLGGMAAVSSQAAAQEATVDPAPHTGGAPDRRGVDDKVDDFFAQKYKVYATKENIWISTPQRFDVDVLALPDSSPIQISRQYFEMRPYRKEWYGRATGVGYGIDFDMGKDSVKVAGQEWYPRAGVYLGAFQSPERGETRNNTVINTFVEASRPIHIGKTQAHLIAGASFNRVSGPDVDRGTDVRLYQQINFPALFGSQRGNDAYSIGRFSGAVKTYVGNNAYGAQAGIYFNELKSEGSGLNYSIGPEVHYDSDRGTSFRLRVRFAPKFL